MLDRKTFLVGRREFLENVRTKAFWIGVLLLPIIIIIAMVVPSWLASRQNARSYAVVDHSGWLLAEVERRAALPDLAKVLEEARERLDNNDPAFAELPQSLQQTVRQLQQVVPMLADQTGAESDEQQRELEAKAISGFADLLTNLGGPEGEEMRRMMPPQALAELEGLRDSIRDWWAALPAEEADKFASGTTKGRYVRVEAGGTSETAIEELNQRVGSGEIFAYFVIPEDPVESLEGASYVSTNLTDDDLQDWFAGLASSAVRERRLAARNIDKQTAQWVQERVRFTELKIGESGKEEAVDTQARVRQFAPMAFTYLLFIAIMSTSSMLMTNTVEEKSNRVMEVLLSSVSPVQLLLGKILGMAATGITMVLAWVATMFGVAKLVPLLMEREIPLDIGAIVADPAFLALFVLYFVLGYCFYAALLIGLGSVCNSIKEAQNLMQPVVFMIIIPLLTLAIVARDPNGTLARVLSYIPPFTPFVMMNRAAGPPPMIEYVLSTLVLLAGLAAVLWASAKVFRIGILMTGKPPKLSEILKWLRAPVGLVPERKN